MAGQPYRGRNIRNDTDYPFSNRVEIVIIRRTGGVMQKFLGTEIAKCVRHELTLAVAVNGSHLGLIERATL